MVSAPSSAPPAGFEPALTAPEAVALSPELWGLCDTKGYQPQAPREHVVASVSGAAPASRHVAAIGEAPAETSYFQQSREFSKNGIAIRRTFIFESDNEFRG